ncbi:MAG: pitrilysin family protein, partial [Pseudomonadota bacterium]
IVAAAGNVDHAQITDQAAALADKLPPGRAPSVAPAQFGGGGGVTERPVEQTHVAVSFDGVSFRDPRYFAAQVFSGLFGGGISSRLFQRAREEKGLCYTIYSFASGYSDAGMFGIYAGTGGEAVDPLMGLVWGELNALAHEGPSPDEVARSKAQLKAGLLMSLESSGARAEQMARHLLAYDRVLGPDELIARVEAVTVHDIQALAQGMMAQERIAWSVITNNAALVSPEAMTGGRG